MQQKEQELKNSTMNPRTCRSNTSTASEEEQDQDKDVEGSGRVVVEQICMDLQADQEWDLIDNLKEEVGELKDAQKEMGDELKDLESELAELQKEHQAGCSLDQV